MFRKAVPLLALPLLLTVACAKEGEGEAQVKTGDAAVSALQAAPDAVADAGTSKFEMTMEITMSGDTVELVASGAYDTTAQQMSMSMDMGDLFEQLAATTGEELPVELGDGRLEMVADGDTVYMHFSFFEALTGSSDWLSMDAEELGAGSLGLGASTSDPTKVLESLRGVTGEPEVVGQEDVRGVETTHYHATMSLADALAKAPDDQRAEIEAALDGLGEDGDADIPIDVWIDADGLPRRMTVDMGEALGALAPGGGGGATMTIELFDYGEPVDIEIPSPDEVTPFSEVMGGFGGSGSPS